MATHARAPHTCHPTHTRCLRQRDRRDIPEPGGEATARSIDFVLHTVDPRSSRCSDEIATTGFRVVSAFLSGEARLLPQPHIYLDSEQQPTLASSDGFLFFLLSSFSFSSLSSKNWHVPRQFFSLSLTQLKAAPNNRAVYFYKTYSPFLSFSKTRRPVGFAEPCSFSAAHSRLGSLSGWVCEPEQHGVSRAF